MLTSLAITWHGSLHQVHLLVLVWGEFDGDWVENFTERHNDVFYIVIINTLFPPYPIIIIENCDMCVINQAAVYVHLRLL